MRKSMVIMLAMVGALFIALTWAAKFLVQQNLEEGIHAVELTKELRDQQHVLKPDTKLRLSRVRGSSMTIVEDRSIYGLRLEATPSDETWKSDPKGRGLAMDLARRLFDVYTADRPIHWVEFHLTKSDGSELAPFAFAKGVGDSILPVEPAKPETPPKPPAK